MAQHHLILYLCGIAVLHPHHHTHTHTHTHTSPHTSPHTSQRGTPRRKGQDRRPPRLCAKRKVRGQISLPPVAHVKPIRHDASTPLLPRDQGGFEDPTRQQRALDRRRWNARHHHLLHIASQVGEVRERSLRRARVLPTVCGKISARSESWWKRTELKSGGESYSQRVGPSGFFTIPPNMDDLQASMRDSPPPPPPPPPSHTRAA